MAYGVGVDIGSTFTDLTLVDDATDPARAVATTLEDALRRTGVKPGQVAQVVHGTCSPQSSRSTAAIATRRAPACRSRRRLSR